ncbi:MAG: RluA family pseudouridine synthase [Oligoflexia bacterium]|nr:RluA family pseudouridine synthase [Oligoflexia bacterium]
MKDTATSVTEIITDSESETTRLDSYLSKKIPRLTRSKIQLLLKEGHILADNKLAKANQKLASGTKVIITIPKATPLEAEPENIPLKILYQDECLAIIDKPAGLVVHPAVGNETGTLVNALLHAFPEIYTGQGIGGKLRPGIVHRIDKHTSGILIIAKEEQTHLALAKQFKEHTIDRKYQGLCWGSIPKNGEFDWPIARDKADRKKMSINTEGRTALTKYQILKSHLGIQHFEATLYTGRTHQIRVHFSHANAPLLGDTIYSTKRGARQAKEKGLQLLRKNHKDLAQKILNLYETNRQFLHATHLSFEHPKLSKRMTFNSEFPDDLLCIFNEWKESK